MAQGAYSKSGGVLDGNVDATGSISGKGVYEYPSIRVYSAVNKPSPGELGALPASGTAVAASKLATTRTIAGVPFDGTANISIPVSNLGVYSKAEVDSRVNGKSNKNTALKSGNGWWKCGDTGMIFQWGLVERKNDKTAVNFPIVYPNKCFNIQLTLGNAYSNSGSNIVAYEARNSGFDYVAYSQEVWAYWFAVGY
ncbi:hypothetical protein GEA64_00925 [Photorhabdus khanii]|uniref:Putative tail fiber protein gp53-like C-terminal domain-containing protein n=1 Tax=Photorhabdus khanii TaxID=1004150 RepID=A0A7C9GGX9_9GAMM|nr:hypothetical protein [Photorhabdus khanii]MQL46638.1 hypothetical protein [Photorhabdus khanii]